MSVKTSAVVVALISVFAVSSAFAATTPAKETAKTPAKSEMHKAPVHKAPMKKVAHKAPMHKAPMHKMGAKKVVHKPVAKHTVAKKS